MDTTSRFFALRDEACFFKRRLRADCFIAWGLNIGARSARREVVGILDQKSVLAQSVYPRSYARHVVCVTHLGVLPDADFTATEMALEPDMMAFAKSLSQAPQGECINLLMLSTRSERLHLPSACWPRCITRPLQLTYEYRQPQLTSV